MNFFRIAIIGLLAGIISGLFSSGGGLILVPAFIYLLNMEDKKARATAIVCILPMVLTSCIFFYKSNYIDWNIALKCAIGGIIGGIVGAKLLKTLSTIYVKIFFVIFLLYIGIKMLITSI